MSSVPSHVRMWKKRTEFMNRKRPGIIQYESSTKIQKSQTSATQPREEEDFATIDNHREDVVWQSEAPSLLPSVQNQRMEVFDGFDLYDGDSDESSYIPSSVGDEQDSDEEYLLAEILDDDYHEGSDEFFIGAETIEEERNNMNNIDTGCFDVLEEILIPWQNKINTRSTNSLNNSVKGSEKIFQGSDFTVQDLATDVRLFVESNGGNNKFAKKVLEEELMVNILMKYFPENSKLPMSFTIRGNKYHYLSTLHEYNEQNDFCGRTQWIDICSSSRNCIAYVGIYKNEIECPTCSSKRYHKCTRPKCALKSYEDCTCDYTGSGRIGKKRQPYRSIIQLFMQLLEFDCFVDLCNTFIAVPELDDMVDIQHGKTYKKHMKECKNRFEEWKKEDKQIRKDYVNVNLMISLFYDGIKVYIWKKSTFMPLIISILNLPPTYRCKFGVGQFIIGLLTVAQGEAGEAVLLDCLVQELLLLDKGIEIVTKNGTKYFLCVRLIQYLLDTPAASKFFNYEGHNSNAGCVYCGRITGKYVKDLKKTVFIGHRFLLPLNHYLRIFGQTGTCCPKDFFPRRLVNRKNTLRKDLDPSEACQIEELKFYEPNPNSAVVQHKEKVFRKTGLCIDSEEHRQNVENFVLDQGPTKTFSWNCDVDQLLFDNYLYFPSCDYRPQCKKFDAKIRFEEMQQLCHKAKQEGTSIQGVKGFNTMSRLPYFNLQEQFCPVNCHVISNNIKEFFLNVKGLNDKATTTICSKNTKSFPWLYRTIFTEDTGELPWNLTKGNREILDAHINCIIVPLGYSQDFQIINPFQQTDVLNMKGKFHAGITLMELIVHWSFKPFDIAYKAFYLLFSKTLVQLTRKKWATNVKIEMIYELERKVNNIASIHEGIFPLALQNFINHQMVDLCFGILLFGSCSGFNSFALERAGGIFKRWLKKGGVATELSIMEKYELFENQSIDAIFSQKLKDIFKVRKTKYKKVFAAINQRAFMDNLDPNQLHFTDQRICLHDQMEKSKSHLSENEVYSLLEDCYKYIIMKIRFGGRDDWEAGYDSALCRVFYCFYGYRKKAEKLHHVTFQQYFEEVCDVANTENPEKILESVYGIFEWPKKLEECEYLRANHADVLLVSRFISDLKYTMNFYKNAHIYGETFNSRNIINTNELKHNWNSPDNIKSWVKYIDFKTYEDANTSFGRRAYNSSDRYMNINYFFRIDFPEETHLHGMAFANGTSRNSFKTKCINPSEWRKPKPSKTKENSSSSSSSSSSSRTNFDQESSIQAPTDNDEMNYLEHILVGDERRSLYQKSTFVPCVYFYASKIVIIPYYVSKFKFPETTSDEFRAHPATSLRLCIDNAKPYLLKDRTIDISEENQRHYAVCQSNEINIITMIDMHPSKCLDYSFNELLQNKCAPFIDRYLFNKSLDYD